MTFPIAAVPVAAGATRLAGTCCPGGTCCPAVVAVDATVAAEATVVVLFCCPGACNLPGGSCWPFEASTAAGTMVSSPTAAMICTDVRNVTLPPLVYDECAGSGEGPVLPRGLRTESGIREPQVVARVEADSASVARVQRNTHGRCGRPLVENSPAVLPDDEVVVRRSCHVMPGDRLHGSVDCGCLAQPRPRHGRHRPANEQCACDDTDEHEQDERLAQPPAVTIGPCPRPLDLDVRGLRSPTERA